MSLMLKMALLFHNERFVKSDFFGEKTCFVGVAKCNVGNRLKRVLAKFEADRSHPQGLNGCSKFLPNFQLSSTRWLLAIVHTAFSYRPSTPTVPYPFKNH